MCGAPVHHPVGALIDAVELLVSIHAAALIQHADLALGWGRRRLILGSTLTLALAACMDVEGSKYVLSMSF